MADRKKVNLKAVTTKEISGECIKKIPAGTIFTVTWLCEKNGGSSVCEGLDINLIYNDEFKLAS
jgi:hypothetical protein